MKSKSILMTIVAILATFAARPAYALISANTVNEVALLSHNERLVLVTVRLDCTAGEQAHIQVTVTQESTGARAEGRTQGVCTGTMQEWTVKASARGPASFEEGAAQACPSAFTRDDGRVTDTRNWCRAGGITLQQVAGPGGFGTR